MRVDWFLQSNPDNASCSLSRSIPPGVAQDFCTDRLARNFTTCNRTCGTELIETEGFAVVSSTTGAACANGAIDARVYYWTGAGPDLQLEAVSNPRVVPLR
jgi:hypothetical protein